MSQNLSLSQRIAYRELTHGIRHFLVFFFCLAFSVAIMSSILSISDIIQKTLSDQSRSMLGGDLEVIFRNLEPPKEIVDYLGTKGELSYVANAKTAIEVDGISGIIELRSIDEKYPLVGNFEIKEDINYHDVIKNNGAIVEKSIFTQFNLKMGDVITIGKSDFVIKGTLVTDADRAVNSLNLGPRVIISHESMKETGLTSGKAIVNYRYRLILDDPEYSLKINQDMGKKFPLNLFIINKVSDSNSFIQIFLDKLTAYLTLSGLTIFLISGIGIAGSIRNYLEKEANTIATLKVLGAESKVIFVTFMYIITFIAVISTIVGVAFSAIIMHFLIPLAGTYIPEVLKYNDFDFYSSGLAVWYGLLITYISTLPYLFSAIDIRPGTLFRHHSGIKIVKNDKVMLVSTFTLIFLLLGTLLFTAKDPVFLISSMIVITFTIMLFWGISLMLETLASKMDIKTSWLRLAIANLHRPGAHTATVVFTIGISLSVILTLALTEINFQGKMDRTLKKKVPEIFMIDILKRQKPDLESYLLEKVGKENFETKAYMQSTLKKINGVDINDLNIKEEDSWAFRTGQPIGSSQMPPANNMVRSGDWWEPSSYGDNFLSIDHDLFNALGLKFGDKLEFDILGEKIETTITNTRIIDYSTFQINFTFIISPGIFDKLPVRYATVIDLDFDKSVEDTLIKDISKTTPGITIVRTAEAQEVVNQILQNVVNAFRAMLIINLFAAIIVTSSALVSLIETRVLNSSVLKIMGAKESDLLKVNLAEWVIISLITSVISIIIGIFSSIMIMEKFNVLIYFPDPVLIVGIITGCLLLIGIISYLGNRELFNFKVVGFLRGE